MHFHVENLSKMKYTAFLQRNCSKFAVYFIFNLYDSIVIE